MEYHAIVQKAVVGCVRNYLQGIFCSDKTIVQNSEYSVPTFGKNKKYTQMKIKIK